MNQPAKPELQDHDASEFHDDIVYPAAIPFVIFHLAAFAAFWSGITTEAIVIGIALYWIRMFAVTGIYRKPATAPGAQCRRREFTCSSMHFARDFRGI